MKAFAVLAEHRYSPLPDVPTMEEVGIPGMQIAFWHGLWAPKGIIAKLNDAVVKSFADPAVQKRIDLLGQTIPAKADLTPEALHKYHKAEVDKWGPIIKAAGIKIQ